jgi:hypothetical protein
MTIRRAVLLSTAIILAAATLAAQARPDTEPLHRPLDQILDINVRDGLVYYRALKSERGRLDRYVASLNVPTATYEGWPREGQMAFWLNAYNAIVLQTVINHYPIKGKAASYPVGSIRQIPGAFDQVKHRAAGRSVTLDEIEKTILPQFKDPRLYLALGRGAVGSGRLRSEAYTTARVMEQLEAVHDDVLTRQEMLKIDRLAGTMSVTPMVSWHEAEFIDAYEKKADPRFAQRSPIERAILGFIAPRLLSLERELIEKNQFSVTFHTFDWRLNDLSGGRVN